MSLVGRIFGSRDQEIKVGVACLPSFPGIHLETLCFPSITSGRPCQPGDQTWDVSSFKNPSKLKAVVAPWSLGDPNARRLTDHQESGPLLHSGDGEKCGWHSGSPLGAFLGIPMPGCNYKQQPQPNKNVIIRAWNPLQSSAWVNPSVKPPILTELIAELEGNPERVMEEGHDDYQLWP